MPEQITVTPDILLTVAHNMMFIDTRRAPFESAVRYSPDELPGYIDFLQSLTGDENLQTGGQLTEERMQIICNHLFTHHPDIVKYDVDWIDKEFDSTHPMKEIRRFYTEHGRDPEAEDIVAILGKFNEQFHPFLDGIGIREVPPLPEGSWAFIPDTEDDLKRIIKESLPSREEAMKNRKKLMDSLSSITKALGGQIVNPLLQLLDAHPVPNYSELDDSLKLSAIRMWMVEYMSDTSDIWTVPASELIDNSPYPSIDVQMAIDILSTGANGGPLIEKITVDGKEHLRPSFANHPISEDLKQQIQEVVLSTNHPYMTVIELSEILEEDLELVTIHCMWMVIHSDLRRIKAGYGYGL